MKIKKIIAVVSAAALTLTVGMTTFAAPSVTGGITGGGTVETENGKELTVTVSDPLTSDKLTEETKQTVSKLVSEDAAAREKAKEEALKQAGVTVPEGKAAEIVGVVDIDIPDLEKGDTAYVTVSVPSAKMGDEVIVLHFNVETGAWEKIPAEVTADGQVKLTITSASPFAFMVLAAVTPDGDGSSAINTPTQGTTDNKTTNNKTTSTTGTKSPKTGESAMVIVLGVIALAAAGTAFSMKKRA